MKLPLRSAPLTDNESRFVVRDANGHRIAPDLSGDEAKTIVDACNYYPHRPVDATGVMFTEDGSKYNGMVNVTMRYVEYRGFTIQPKLDMGVLPHLSHANSYRTGWVVVKDGCNPMPGASYNTSILEARASIDLWIESGFDADVYWKLMEPYRY